MRGSSFFRHSSVGGDSSVGGAVQDFSSLLVSRDDSVTVSKELVASRTWQC